MVSLCSPVWPGICGDPPASVSLHVWLLFVFKVNLSMHQKSILFKGWIIFCSWIHVFLSNFYLIMYVCGGVRTYMVNTYIPCACWGQNVISQELLPSYLLSSGTCLANTFTPARSLGTICFLFVVHFFFGHKLPPPVSSVDNAWELPQSVWSLLLPVSRCWGVAVSFRNTRGPARESVRLCLPALLIFRTEQQ